jgi:hypothetical protein
VGCRVVVYASSQDFVETALGQPYLNTKGAFMRTLYLIPGFSTPPDHIQTHTKSRRESKQMTKMKDACDIPKRFVVWIMILDWLANEQGSVVSS